MIRICYQGITRTWREWLASGYLPPVAGGTAVGAATEGFHGRTDLGMYGRQGIKKRLRKIAMLHHYYYKHWDTGAVEAPPPSLTPPDDYWIIFAAAQIARKWYVED